MIEKNEKVCQFNNKKEELEYYKSKYESFFKELVKYQLKVKSLENSNNKLREKVSNFLNLNSTKKNNSESNFLTPLEFKKLWEYIVKSELIEAFDFCINEYILIANLCQDIMLLVYEECKKNINNKFIEVLNCLNLGKISKDKRAEMYNHFLPFFRENFNKIFIFSENFSKIVYSKLMSVISEYNYSKDIINENISESRNSINEKNYSKDENSFGIVKIIKEKIKQNNFNNIIRNFYKICIYMLLHDPILSFDLENYSNRKLKYFYFNKNDFINVDGFINDNSPCILLLSAPLLKKKFNFHNLRAPVYIVNNPDKMIIEECEKHKKEKIDKDENINLNNGNLNSDRIIKIELEEINDEYINNNKKNKTFEEKFINNNEVDKKKSKIQNYINENNDEYIKCCYNVIKTNNIKSNANKDFYLNKEIKINNNEFVLKKIYDKKIKANKSVEKSIKRKNDINSNSTDSKKLYMVSQPNNNKNTNLNPGFAQKLVYNFEKKNSNDIYHNYNKYPYFNSSSTWNIGIETKDKNNSKEKNNNKKSNLNNEDNFYEIIMGNLNKLKETKLKEYYINNKNKNKNGLKNKSSKYCIKNHIYTNIKNMPNTVNNRIIEKKNNCNQNNSQHFDLFLEKKISPCSSNLFKSYETYNDSSELNNASSPKNEKYKNYNSFTHLLKFSNINSLSNVNTPNLSSQNTVYNNLVLKGIKSNFESNIYKNGMIKNSTNNITYNTKYNINFNNNSNININNIHNSNNSNINKNNNYNPLSNRKKYISYVKKNEKKYKENKSEIKERSSLNNYLKVENKNKSKNYSNISSKQVYNNMQRNSNLTNNSKKNKKIHKKIIKNSIIISEGNNKYLYNCKKINNNDIRNKNNNLNNKGKYKNSNSNKKNNKLCKKNNNYTIYKNNSNNNIKINGNIYLNNFNEESNLFKFSPNNTFIQKTINKSSSPENNYLKINKNNLYENVDRNNNLFHRNSNITIYNNYFTSESENNLSSNKNNQQSFQMRQKTKRKVSNSNYNIYTNKYVQSNKTKLNKHKEKVIKFIKSIKVVSKYNINSKKIDGDMKGQNAGLKQIYKNSKYSSQKPINSFPLEIHVKTEGNNKETPFKEVSILNKLNKIGIKNKTIEENKKSSSLKKNNPSKRQISLSNNYDYISFDKINTKK